MMNRPLQYQQSSIRDPRMTRIGREKPTADLRGTVTNWMRQNSGAEATSRERVVGAQHENTPVPLWLHEVHICSVGLSNRQVK